MSENLSGRLIDLIRERTGVADLPVVISCDDRRYRFRMVMVIEKRAA